MEPQPTAPVQSASPVPHIPSAPTSTPKWPWILGGLALLILVGTGGVFLGKQMAKTATHPVPVTTSPSPAADVTSNWKTYAGEKYSFKYPIDLEVVTPPPDTKIVLELANYVSPNISVELISGLTNAGFGCLKFIRQEDVVVDGRTLAKGFNSGIQDALCDNPHFRQIWVTLDSQAGDYLTLTYDESTISMEAIFDQILSTFKFTDSSPSPTESSNIRTINYSPLASWIKHVSPMGFTFSYSPSYSAPTYEVTKRQIDQADNNSIISYCTLDLRESNPANFIQIHVAPYDGRSRRQFIMDLTALFAGDIKSTQEARLGNLSGLLVDFHSPYASPPITVYDHTAIFIKGSTALVVYNSLLDSNPVAWNSLLSSIKVDSNLTANLDNCK